MKPTIELTLLGMDVSLKTYTAMAVIAMIAAFVLMYILLKRLGYRFGEITLLFSVAAFSFLIGARLLNYAIHYPSYTKEGYHLFTLEFARFSVYGGMFLAALSVIPIIKLFKKDFWPLADTMVFPYLVAFAIMRVGCFLNGCCYGIVCHNPLGIAPPHAKVNTFNTLNSLLPIIEVPIEKIYPTQLMEMGFALLFLPIGLWLYRVHNGKGIVFGLSIVYFSAFRWFVLYFRDLPYSAFVVNTLYPAIYFGCMTIGLLIFFLRKKGIRN